MKIIDCEQGSEEWKRVRAGKVTASRISDMIATTKSGAEAAGRRNYRAQLVAEILTGEPYMEGYQSAEMKWGIEQEPYAAAAYELEHSFDVPCTRVGFVIHPTIDRAGCSPDRLVGDRGMVQFKCPNTATHIEYLLAKRIPPEHEPQLWWELACTGRDWIDFVSFDPRMPKKFRLFVARMQFVAAEPRIRYITAEVKSFLEEVDLYVNRVNSLLPER